MLRQLSTGTRRTQIQMLRQKLALNGRRDDAASFGIEEDGNLPDSDSGETRFDSGGPDDMAA